MKWSPENDAIVIAMKAEGASLNAMATRVNRSAKGVSGRLRWLSLSPAQRLRESGSRRRGVKPLAQVNQRRVAQLPTDFVPDSVLRERDERSAIAPRSLTAMFFGDPIPGHSALERRQVQP